MEDLKEKEDEKRPIFDWEAQKPDEKHGIIYPDNQRVRDKLRQRKELEDKKRSEEEKKKKLADRTLNKKNAALAREEAEREKKRLEMEAAQMNYEKYEDSVKNGSGNLNEIFSTILRNTSAYELSFPNYNMRDGWDFRLLMTILERNTSLLTLSLSRKHLGDVEAKKIAEMLSKNKKLRRLELEGNFFGPKSASAFGEALKKNVTLRYLDLENNNLTDGGKDISGIKDLCSGLQSNTMLISLNLANNCLNGDAGALIIDMFRSNKTIINLEFFDNKEFTDREKSLVNEKKDETLSKYCSVGLYINQIAIIKENLKHNYDAYMKMRTDEWKERQRMTSNYQDNVDTQIIIEQQKMLEETRKKEQESIEMLYMQNFEDNVKAMNEEFNNKVNEYFALTKERQSKKKGKKKKKKK